ncbi:hypothetical protein C2G38_1993553 [Gigaspora rosea]|uniref:Cas12f1-like TNB domain-containing protein n=1 Tax=Gigaspora rosea TaxID=44941 RepID=A0A397TT97_9GLOM|nr:hypothetical protein C2G38_1993553 [Gigaspora rosea]
MLYHEFKGCKIIECTKKYTSKIYKNCGFIKNNLDGSKTFICTLCDLEINKDINGA